MDLRHLRYFVAVAEELHFTRAAERLGMKQPPLSQQIRQLERELGTSLLRRLTRGVELTDSGALLLEEARRILDHVERTKAAVQSCARGETGRMRVGFASATYFQSMVTGIVRAYRERFPGVLLTPEQSLMPRLLAALHSGEIDIAFVRSAFSDDDRLGIELLVEEPMLAVLPASHTLAGERSVALAALSSDTFIIFPREYGPVLYDAIVASCQRAGFTPQLDQEAPQIPSIVPMVAAGFGVSLVPQSIRQIHTEGVVYLPIEGEAPGAPISLAYRRGDRSMAVRNFVALAKRHAHAAPARTTVNSAPEMIEFPSAISDPAARHVGTDGLTEIVSD
jgi:DNA-binding transcriptional LysR family regulator